MSVCLTFRGFKDDRTVKQLLKRSKHLKLGVAGGRTEGKNDMSNLLCTLTGKSQFQARHSFERVKLRC